ncbi:MAG: hypothetical protein ISR65_05515 [Bacteriovoracaceae bacterium]|nr:hypothetical protein [Bacteriovoracaceae bacterium]
MKKSSNRIIATLLLLLSTPLFAGNEHKLGMSLYLDMVKIGDNKENIKGGIESRKALIALESKYGDDWETELGFDIKGKDKLSIKDAWVSYAGLGKTIIKFGNHKVPFGLDCVTSSKSATFMELSMASEFCPGRKVGLSVNAWDGRWWTFHGGLFGDSVGNGPEGEDPDKKAYENIKAPNFNEELTVAGRLTVRPIMSDNMIFHLGFSGFFTDPPNYGVAELDKIDFEAPPEINLHAKELIGDDIENVSNFSGLSFDAVFVWKQLSFQGEYFIINVDQRATDLDPKLSGYFAQASYFVTGESKKYKKRTSKYGGASRPNRSWGALEVAVRYSLMDLNDFDANIAHGKEKNITFGLNWHVNKRAKVLYNFVTAITDEHAGDDKFTIHGVRVQYTF